MEIDIGPVDSRYPRELKLLWRSLPLPKIADFRSETARKGRDIRAPALL